MEPTILLVDDDTALLAALKRSLSGPYRAEVARSGFQALAKLEQNHYQCVLLDLGLPDMSGLEVCRRVRKTDNPVPIIVLSGNDSVVQKAELLDAGADDYLTKPADGIELEARIRTAIRRAASLRSQDSSMSLQGVTLDSQRHTVEREGMAIKLRPKEFTLLECLMRRSGLVVNRATLLQYAWEADSDVWPSVVDVHIKYLRDKLDYPFEVPLIKTVHGLGYKFDASSVANKMKGGTKR